MKMRIAVLVLSILVVSCMTSPDSAGKTDDPDHPAISSADLILESLDIWEDERNPEAIELLMRASEIDPRSSVPLLLAAKRYKHAEKYADALRMLNRAIDIDPNSVRARLLRAEIILDTGTGDKKTAMSDLEIAWRIRPGDVDTGLFLASRLSWSEPERAEEIYKSLVSVQNPRVEAVKHYAIFLKDQKRSDEARKLIIPVLERDFDPWLQMDVAGLLVELGLRDEASTLVQRSLDSAGDDEYLVARGAEKFFDMGLWQESLDLYARAEDQGLASSPEAYFQQALAGFFLGDKRKSIAILEKSLQAGDGWKWSLLARALLAGLTNAPDAAQLQGKALLGIAEQEGKLADWLDRTPWAQLLFEKMGW